MKRVFLYILILGALWFTPLNRIDIADLEPVQAVWLYRQQGKIVLQTDTGAYGTGESVAEALENLKTTTPGIVYLDTAEYLLVSENAVEELCDLVGYVKRSVRLCRWEGQGTMEAAIDHARAHRLGTKICQWKTGDKLPNLPLQNTPK